LRNINADVAGDKSCCFLIQAFAHFISSVEACPLAVRSSLAGIAFAACCTSASPETQTAQSGKEFLTKNVTRMNLTPRI